MNEHEARLEIARTMRDVLVDLADDGEMSDEEFDIVDTSMLDAVEIIMEALDFQVLQVEGDGQVTVKMSLPGPPAETGH